MEIHKVDLTDSLPAAIELQIHLEENALWRHHEKAVCRPTQGNKKLAKLTNKSHWHSGNKGGMLVLKELLQAAKKHYSQAT